MKGDHEKPRCVAYWNLRRVEKSSNALVDDLKTNFPTLPSQTRLNTIHFLNVDAQTIIQCLFWLIHTRRNAQLLCLRIKKVPPDADKIDYLAAQIRSFYNHLEQLLIVDSESLASRIVEQRQPRAEQAMIWPKLQVLVVKKEPILNGARFWAGVAAMPRLQKLAILECPSRIAHTDHTIRWDANNYIVIDGLDDDSDREDREQVDAFVFDPKIVSDYETIMQRSAFRGALAGLKYLKTLILSGCALSSTPVFLSLAFELDFSNVECIDLSHSQLKSEHLERLLDSYQSALTQLKELDLRKNGWTEADVKKAYAVWSEGFRAVRIAENAPCIRMTDGSGTDREIRRMERASERRF